MGAWSRAMCRQCHCAPPATCPRLKLAFGFPGNAGIHRLIEWFGLTLDHVAQIQLDSTYGRWKSCAQLPIACVSASASDFKALKLSVASFKKIPKKFPLNTLVLSQFCSEMFLQCKALIVKTPRRVHSPAGVLQFRMFLQWFSFVYGPEEGVVKSLNWDHQNICAGMCLLDLPLNYSA